jgi:hypothetical protein
MLQKFLPVRLEKALRACRRAFETGIQELRYAHSKLQGKRTAISNCASGRLRILEGNLDKPSKVIEV